MTLETLTDILKLRGCSCVISNNGQLTEGTRRGVADLYRLLKQEPETLRSALIADKVVGKGAAALMILGGISGVSAGIVSEPALRLLEKAGVKVIYGQLVPNIINRTGTDVCPVETLCRDCATAEECLPLIDKFITSPNTSI